MASPAPRTPLMLLFVAVLAVLVLAAEAAELSLEFHHKFSDRVQQWTARHGGGSRELWRPEHGTMEYYETLASHDQALRGRLLGETSYDELTFSTGNETIRLSDLGYLYYTIVALGTPNVTFLVALDTGSDLLWVPCNCQQCASLTYGNVVFDTYNPGASTSSQKLSCSDNLCPQQSGCSTSNANSSCTYALQYASANTSSSGYLVEDILYLTTGDTAQQIIQASIVFGCAEVQTGSFLDGAAPNGLFGLGMQDISVPSILSSKGLTANSFSMCFGEDGVGRINFGDKGTTDQQETALVVDSTNGYYQVNLTGIVVGNSSITTAFTAIVDSGTSFTYLADPMYTELTQSFNSQVQETQTDQNLTFEFCYEISTSEISVPEINLTMNGGSSFPVNDPTFLIGIQGQQNGFYCLAVLKSSQQNIIGQNFLTGLRVVFDREDQVLGWKNFNCYSESNSSTSDITPNDSSVAKKTGSNTTQVTVPGSSPSSSPSSHLNSLTSISLFLLLLPLVIL